MRLFSLLAQRKRTSSALYGERKGSRPLGLLAADCPALLETTGSLKNSLRSNSLSSCFGRFCGARLREMAQKTLKAKMNTKEYIELSFYISIFFFSCLLIIALTINMTKS